MACIGFKLSPKLNKIFRRKKSAEEKDRILQRREEREAGGRGNFYFSLEVRSPLQELDRLARLQTQHSSVYSWLYGQQQEEDYYCSSSASSSPSLTARLASLQPEHCSLSSHSQDYTSREEVCARMPEFPPSYEEQEASLFCVKEEEGLHYACTNLMAAWRSPTKASRSLGSTSEEGSEVATEYVYLDFGEQQEGSWQITKKPLCPVKTAFV